MKRVLTCLLIIPMLLPTVFANQESAESTEIAASAESAILMDATTGTVLYEKNADQRALIASTTKIMTALVALESASLDETLEVPAEAAGVEGSSMYLTAGQQVTVSDLLYGLMLKSGNDAAAALAIHCAGSVDAFAERMNKKAHSLGMRGSSFQNPHGLNAEGHFSTARDMALLTRAALQNEMLSRIVSSKYAKVGDITIKNHNRLLWSYPGADGVKTGYTMDAGRCLVSSATRDGMRLIAVTLNDRDDWADHTAMLDHGFDNYDLMTVCEKGVEVAKVRVFGKGLMPVVAAHTVKILLREDEEPPDTEMFIPQYVWTPVLEGQRVGILTTTLDGEKKARCPLIAGGGIH